MQPFSADTTIFFEKLKKKCFAPQNIKNCPQKLFLIPLDQEFSVQQVFALCNWDSDISSSLKLGVQLTLFQPGGAQIMPITLLLAPQDLKTPLNANKKNYKSFKTT